ncbi:unnamed protein product [Rangifer tarandus platyrhynchus]|uniref:Uncharacterized protein n=1 Tax=Rangifer tarandus platyrhynchus TaxID=3082113 RepID=A0AC59YJH5_RANTA
MRQAHRHLRARTIPVTAEDDQVRDSQACGLEDEEVGTQDTAWITPRMREEKSEGEKRGGGGGASPQHPRGRLRCGERNTKATQPSPRRRGDDGKEGGERKEAGARAGRTQGRAHGRERDGPRPHPVGAEGTGIPAPAAAVSGRAERGPGDFERREGMNAPPAPAPAPGRAGE